MEIILQEDVEKLGTRGQVVDVANGYARNFLLPRNLGIEATPGNLKRLEKMRATFAKKEATEKEAAQKLAELLSAVSLSFTRKAGKTTSFSAQSPRVISPTRSRFRATRSKNAKSSSPIQSKLSASIRFRSNCIAKLRAR